MGRTALRVCTIEDDAVDRMMIHRLLDQDPTWKVEFAEFATGRDAIENLPEADVDVILLDSRIDRAEGGTVLAEILALGLEAPVIALTAAGEEAVAIALLRAGAIDTIPKSKISTSSLQRAITNAIEKQSLRSAMHRFRATLEERDRTIEQYQETLDTLCDDLTGEWTRALSEVGENLSSLAGGDPDSATPAQVEGIERCIHRLSELQSVLEARVDRQRLAEGRLTLEPAPVAVEELLTDLVTSVARRAESAGVTVSTEEAEGVVLADRVRLGQVLEQLFEYALATTPAGGSIHVEALKETRSTLTISVSDTGAGIPLDEQEDFFSVPLVSRSDSDVVRGSESRALSPRRELGVAKRLVELHGGAIWLESTPGHGTCFSFTVPLSETVPVSDSVLVSG